jgi:uncharacterized surface protein with fasciclin (FAS1) repeats
MKRLRRVGALLALGGLAVAASAAPAAAAESRETSSNIVETAVAAGQFTTLASLLEQAGLVDTLATGGPFTVFAPTDAAFAKVPQATLDELAADPAKLKAVLLYHVAEGRIPASEVTRARTIMTLNGQAAPVRVTAGGVRVAGALVVQADVAASNGVIHVIDSVMIPGAPPSKDIVQTAVAAGSFKTLASLLKKAGLDNALRGNGPFTVFAPTDAAFARVPKATLKALAANRAKLRAVLLYHVAKGKLTAAKVTQRSSVKTLNGQSVRIRATGGKVFVAGARVVTADVAASLTPVAQALIRCRRPRTGSRSGPRDGSR